MQQSLFEDVSFDKTGIQDVILKNVEFDQCRFLNCDLSSQDLSGAQFTDCEFTDCNLCLVNLRKTALRNVKFKNCKMLGLRFDECNGFGLAFTFENCILNYSSFFKSKIKNTVFSNTQLVEVDFTESDFTGSVFDNCNLSNAVFYYTVLEKADFSTSYNYSIHPETNRVKKAKFSFPGVLGLLKQYDIEIIE